MCEYESFDSMLKRCSPKPKESHYSLERTRLKKSFESLMQYPETKVVWIKTKLKDGHEYIEGIYKVKPSVSKLLNNILDNGEYCNLYKAKLFNRGTQINISENKAILTCDDRLGEIIVTTKDPFVFTRFSVLIMCAYLLG